MKITINRQSFLRSFSMAAAVAPARSPKPILQNVKLESGPDGIVLTATDTEVGIRVAVPDVDVAQPGAAVISVARLAKILRESSDDSLTITTDDSKTTIKGSSSRFVLESLNPDEFPEVAGFDASDYFEIDSEVLVNTIKRAIFAADSESSRYALGGLMFDVGGKSMNVVGTDGRRIAVSETPVSSFGKPPKSTPIVPARACSLIQRVFGNEDARVQFVPSSKDLILRTSSVVFFARLLEGRFPKWRDVMPSRTDSSLVVMTTGIFNAAIRQAAIVASDESRGIDFKFKTGSLVMESSTAEIGTSHIEVPVDYDGPEMTVTLDHRFVEDFLKVLSSDSSFTFDFLDAESQVLLETEEYSYVIMPLSRGK